MKHKRVMLMIECRTNLPIALLRQKGLLMVEVVDIPDTSRYARKLRVLQVQANVIRNTVSAIKETIERVRNEKAGRVAK